MITNITFASMIAKLINWTKFQAGTFCAMFSGFRVQNVPVNMYNFILILFIFFINVTLILNLVKILHGRSSSIQKMFHPNNIDSR